MSRSDRLTPDQLLDLPQLDLLAHLGLPSIHVGGLAATKKLLEWSRLDGVDTVLDVGCGTGAMACYAAKKYGYTVIGVDLNTWMLARAMERTKRRHIGDRVYAVRGDAIRLPFSRESFGLVVAQSVLYLLERRKALIELKRVLKPHGRIGALEFAWLDSPSNELADEISRLRGVTLRTLTHEEWRKAFMNAGFEEIRSEYFRSDRPNILELLRESGVREFVKVWWRFLRIPSARKKRIRKAWRLELTSEELGYGIYCWRKKQ